MKNTLRDTLNKTAYIAAVNLINTFDSDAAEYLVEEAPLLEEFSYDSELDCCFIFDNTPQGCNYWWNIADKLYELRVFKVYSLVAVPNKEK